MGVQRWIRAAAFTVMLCLTQNSVQADKAPFVEIGGQKIPIEPAFEDYAFMLEDACKVMDLGAKDCLIYPMMGNIAFNAVATEIDGNKVIVYDRRLSSRVGVEGAQAVIAHEFGHHYCGHLSKTSIAKQELEADAFAGAVMRKMGFTLDAAKSYVVLLSKQPSSTHPAQVAREKSVEDGWRDPILAKACKAND